MSIYGIVSEFNPFHNGHGYLIRSAKSCGAENIICVMSGNTVQRGEFALTDKYTRAKAALECGADLVLELPFPWCSASAEYFAAAAVYILGFFADTVFFGSETGNAKLLSRAAEIVAERNFKKEYAERLNEGQGGAAAYFGLLEKSGIKGLSSNDILGIEYMKAAKRFAPPLDFKTVRRVGADYLDERLRKENGEFQSASGIRRALRGEGGFQGVAEFLPPESFVLLRKAEEKGDIFNPEALDGYIRLFFALAGKDDFRDIAEADGGVAERLIYAAQVSTSAREMFERAKTKRYTDSKLRRAILFALTGTEAHTLGTRPAYVNLLAAGPAGRKILADARRKGGITVITKPSDAPKTAPQFVLTEKADILFAAGLSCSAERRNMLKRVPFIKE